MIVPQEVIESLARDYGIRATWGGAVEPGQFIRVDGRTFERLSACIAKHRLLKIVRQDREAVPCGRWVRVSLIEDCMMAFALALAGASESVVRQLVRPRYRYEVRR
jgi:hypothetical protein